MYLTLLIEIEEFVRDVSSNMLIDYKLKTRKLIMRFLNRILTDCLATLSGFTMI